MRIVVVGGWAPSLLKFRGPLLAAMVGRGHQVTAMAADQDAETTAGLADIGVDFQAIGVERAGLDPRRDVQLVRELQHRMRALRAEQFFAYTIKPVVYGAMAARAAGVPRRAAMITGLGYAFAPPSSVKHRAVSAVARGMYRLGLAQCQQVFFQNPDDKAEFGRLGLLPKRTAVEIVRGSGVDVDHYAVAPLEMASSEGRTFLFVGRLLADKGIREYAAMARAVRAVRPATRFLVAGWLDPNPTSVSQAELDGWIREGSIEYLGAQADIRPAIARAQVLVLPSYREGTPRSVLEAMSMGRAIITTDAPGCRETIVDGEQGLLVPVRDAAALTRAGLALTDDPALLQRMGTAARQRIVQLYDARAVANHMLDTLGL
ncbi:MAG TPA: glycosyltransferase family 4 protein [Kofleriaceae bacterium]|nr:glycosyltransferase family 4 protein [Kofleriaceae bacterium]